MNNLYGICYKTKTANEFLFKQCYGKEKAEKVAEKYNAMLPCNGKIDGLDFSTVVYFFAEESCEMY